MIISLGFFGYEDGGVFQTDYAHGNYYELESTGGLVDQIFVDNSTSLDKTSTKTNDFHYSTIINAKFEGNLEGGSIQAGGSTIDRIRFQKRRADDLYWVDVAELKYDYPNKKLYEALDKYVQNDFEYEYSLLPVTNNVLGSRILSGKIRANFEGYYISDKDNNYRFYLNAELGTIEHVTNNSVMSTLNGKYPIVTYGNLDYRQGSLQALIMTNKDVQYGTININEEKQLREKLLSFLKNKRPKILRGMGGELMMIGITGNPSENSFNSLIGATTISLEYVEIDEINSISLRENDLIEILSLSEV